MDELKDLKKQLATMQNKRKRDLQIKGLKRQIKAEQFAQSKGGKIFNKIADVGDAMKKVKGSPKKSGSVLSVKEVMSRLPQ